MPLHGKRDQYSDAPKWVADSASGQTGQEQFGNTVYGVDPTEAQLVDSVVSPGWVRRVEGTGPVVSFVINDGGTGYANDDVVEVSGGTANAAANVVTDGSGVITEVVLSDGGAGFTNPDVAVVDITTSGGSGANVEVTTGGRSGRVNIETLVAMRSMDTDATDFANTSSDDVANTTGTADDSVFPKPQV